MIAYSRRRTTTETVQIDFSSRRKVLRIILETILEPKGSQMMPPPGLQYWLLLHADHLC